MTDAVGVDVGGTNVRVAVVASDGTPTSEQRAATPFGDADALVRTIADLVGACDPTLPVGVGIAGGVLADGTLCGAPNLGTDGLPVRAALTAALGRDVVVVNDADAATWAETKLGAARGHDQVLMLTLGTGVGGGVVTNGRLLRGATGLAGELGHVVVDDGGPACACGNRGCLEAHASGAAMALDGRPPEEVLAAARAGEEAASAHLAGLARWLGVGLASLVAVLDPSIIVLGGGAGTAAFDVLADPARAALAERVFARDHREPPPVVVAELGDRAGVIGAALLADRPRRQVPA